jgi:hypothetical protein
MVPVGVRFELFVDDVERSLAFYALSADDAAFVRARDVAVPDGGQVERLAARPWGQTDFRLVDPDGYYVRVTSAG